jgi:hypothetical protein
VLAVEFFGDRFIYVPANPTVGAGGYYWCDLDGDDIADGRQIDGENFANAETAPDGLLDCKVVRDSLFLLGQSTIERHEVTTDPDLPFQKIPHTTQARGVIATGCCCEADNTLHWIGAGRHFLPARRCAGAAFGFGHRGKDHRLHDPPAAALRL